MKTKEEILKMSRKELDVIGRLVDSSRDGIVNKLISMEAIGFNKKHPEIYDRWKKAWDEHQIISDKLDNLRKLNEGKK